MSAAHPAILAVIPARGGSRGIPRKNLATVGGRTLLERVADVVASLPEIHAAVLSTDDEEIAAEGSRVGLLVPFRRPVELSGDHATSIDAWRHAWLAAEEALQTHFELSVLLEPSSPLRRAADVRATIEALMTGEHRAAATVSSTPAHYTQHKTLLIDTEGHLSPLLGPAQSPTIRQQIPPQFHRNGICYAAWRETVVERRTITEDACVAVVIDRPVVNVDEPLDLELAEWLLGREQSTP